MIFEMGIVTKTNRRLFKSERGRGGILTYN